MKRLARIVSTILCLVPAWTCTEPEPTLESILINQKAIILDIGEEYQLNAILYPPEAHPTVFWESLNPTIAAVNKNGLVTGISGGPATIKASAADLSATCEVWVNEADVPMKWLRCRESEMTMVVGDELHLLADYEPDNTTEVVSWKSSNPAVASIRQWSIVTAVAPGEAVLTATSSLTRLTASCKVTVKEKYTAVSSVKLDCHEHFMDAGNTLQLKATVKPDNATNPAIAWSSSAPKVVTVDENGLVTGLSEGDAVITATAEGKSDQCLFHVRIAPVSAEFKDPEITLHRYEERQLELVLLPAGSKERSIQWRSSDQYTVHVSTDGLATGIKAGQATISAQVDELPWVTCTITVVEEVKSVSLDKTELSLSRGSTYRLTATVSPEGFADFDHIEWTSSVPTVAEVDQTGLVMAKGGGETVITATAGGKSAQCRVSVFVAPEAIAFATPERTIRTGESIRMDLAVTPSDASLEGLAWKSSDATIARVDANGLVTGLKGGIVTITAQVPSLPEATCQVTVLQPVQSVTLDKSTLSLSRGSTYTLTATVSPAQFADYDRVEWSSSVPSVAEVDQTGLVTAKGGGETVITATAGGKSAQCRVSVFVAPTAIAFATSEQTIRTGESVRLDLVVTPSDATLEGIEWKSSDTSVARVDANGTVTGVKGGKVSITAKVPSLPEATCQVTVLQPVQSVKLDKTTLSLSRGETFRLTATVSPAQYADYDRVEWSSSNDGVAVVDQTGLVTCTGSGTAVISAVAGGKSASCTVTGRVNVESLTLDETSLSLGIGEIRQLVATILPSDATVQTATWSSSNTGIVTVDKNGNVKGVKVGTATVTATADGQKATCEVTVTNRVTSLTLNVTTLQLRQGETYQFTATVKPTNATHKEVSWSVSNTSVASIDTSGLLTTKKEGSVTVTASVQDGLTATCEVTISNQTGGGGHEGTGEETWY